MTDAISVYTHMQTHIHYKLYVYMKNTLYIWKSAPQEELPLLFPNCTGLSQSLIGCLGIWSHTRDVCLVSFPVLISYYFKSNRNNEKKKLCQFVVPLAGVK